jgi:cysteine-rich repeat protein
MRMACSLLRGAFACLAFVLLTLTGCPTCEDCSADGSSGTDTDTDTDTEPAVCGDAIVQPGEECDDGNTNELDTCTALCVATEPPVLELSFSAIKQFDFSWAVAPAAEFYQLLESPALGEPFVQLGGDIVGESISITMPLHLRVNASYMLRACNADSCLDSASVDVASNLTEAVGYFKASNTQAVDVFGYSLALSGDGNTLAVGAAYECSSAPGIDGDQANEWATHAGAVYVFARNGGVWVQQAYVKASNPDTWDAFGSSVTLSSDGNTLAVGAPQTESEGYGGTNNQGAVYVFVRNGANWSQQTYVKASNPGASDGFGWDVAVSGDGNTLAVGAAWERSSATGVGGNQDDNSMPGAGAVYVFARNNGVWSQQAYVKASNTNAGLPFDYGGDLFGWSVALSDTGDTLAVGAHGESSSAMGIDGDQTDSSMVNAGAVYVFARNNGVWSQQAYVKASNTGLQDVFGFSVALSGNGDTLAVGAHGEDSNATGVGGDQDDNSAWQAGAVYVFVRNGGVWSQQAYVKASNTGAEDQFGWSVALSRDGNTLAIGAKGEDSNATGVAGNQADDSAPDSGAAYVFVREGTNWSQQAYVKASNIAWGWEWGVGGYEVGVASDGNTVAVSNAGESSNATGVGGNQDDTSMGGSGAVYLY